MKEQWVILDWDLPNLKLLQASRQGNVWTVQTTRICHVPDVLCQPGEGRGLAEWLRHEHPDFRWESGENGPTVQTAIFLPRDRVTMRHLALPVMPSEELPTVVPLQMAAQLTTRLEDLVVDYLPESLRPDQQGLSVYVAGLPTSSLNNLRQFAEAFSTQLRFVGISSCALHELARGLSPELATQENLLVSCAAPDRIETLQLQKNQQVSSGYRRRISSDACSSKELIAEVRRLQVLQQNPSDTETEASAAGQLLLILSGEAQTAAEHSLKLAEELSRSLNLPVCGPDWDLLAARIQLAPEQEAADSPLALFWQQNLLTLCGGLLAVQEARVPQINFLEPRKPAEARDNRKAWTIGGAVAALVVLGLAWWMWSQTLTNLKNEITEVEQKIRDADTFLRTKGTVLKQANTLADYENRSLHGTSHLGNLLESLPERSELVINSWRAVPLSGTTHTRILARGIAKTRREIEQLAEKLDQAGLTVRSPVIRLLEESLGQYHYEFDLDYEIPVSQTPVSQLSVSGPRS